MHDNVFIERFGKDANSGIRFDGVLMAYDILKVEVEDSGTNPHIDEPVCNLLEKIMVEHPDWLKSTETTRNELREITLKWSGSNATYIASVERIRRLTAAAEAQATNLSIPTQADFQSLCPTTSVPQLYGSRNWAQTNLEEFPLRLNQNANRNDTARGAADSKAQSALGSTKTFTEEKNERPNPAQHRSKGPKIEVIAREGKKGDELVVGIIAIAF
ncbi:hypothetical protein PT974_05548 [Cladobotryum mycophilum]|uniref:Uncharacterized protein n=1 Tax=Cladobotryum mycophilum TaxID=491253 RepID=A0ABR0SJ38_9HYPO